jgi:hypothetical protein
MTDPNLYYLSPPHFETYNSRFYLAGQSTRMMSLRPMPKGNKNSQPGKWLAIFIGPLFHFL